MVTPMGKVTCGRAYVKYKGPYDWDGLYKVIYKWLNSRRYRIDDKRYKEKATETGGELKVDITGDRRETAYTKRHMAIKIRIWDMKEKMTEVEGEKKLMTSGRLLIEIQGDITLDWQGIFKGSKWKEIMGNLYAWVMKKEYELLYLDDQQYEVLRLEYEIKKHLKMESATMAFMNAN